MATAKRLDLFRAHQKEYSAAVQPRLLPIGRARYLALDGRGEAFDMEFALRLSLLQHVAEAIELHKRRAGHDFAVSRLEVLWWARDGFDRPQRLGKYRLLIRVPEFVSAHDLALARRATHDPTAHEVSLETLEEGICVQALAEPAEGGRLRAARSLQLLAAESGFAPVGYLHEVYLDAHPTRASRTLLRQPVRALPAMHPVLAEEGVRRAGPARARERSLRIIGERQRLARP